MIVYTKLELQPDENAIGHWKVEGRYNILTAYLATEKGDRHVLGILQAQVGGDQRAGFRFPGRLTAPTALDDMDYTIAAEEFDLEMRLNQWPSPAVKPLLEATIDYLRDFDLGESSPEHLNPLFLAFANKYHGILLKASTLNCPDCKNTPGWYVGFMSREPCRTCKGSARV